MSTTAPKKNTCRRWRRPCTRSTKQSLMPDSSCRSTTPSARMFTVMCLLTPPSGDFAHFIEKDFAFYARQYLRLRQAAETLTRGLECIYYNAQNNFTLQYPVLFAPLRVEDAEEEILRKLRITGSYLDILIARRIWNWHAIDYSTMQY